MSEDAAIVDAMLEIAAGYAIPVCWIAADSGKPLAPDSGTAFLLDCGKGPFLVTAAHVYTEGHRKICEKYSDAVCVLGELVRFDLDARLIASDSDWDVATFQIEEREIQALKGYGKTVLTGSQSAWPPEPPRIDQGVFFLGFPGAKRALRPYRGKSEVEMEWVGEAVFTLANEITETHVTIFLDCAQSPEHFRGSSVLVADDFGGCSGAPLLTFVEAKGVFSWCLAGIIVRANTLDKDGGLVMVQAARADCLKPDGAIIRNPRVI